MELIQLRVNAWLPGMGHNMNLTVMIPRANVTIEDAKKMVHEDVLLAWKRKRVRNGSKLIQLMGNGKLEDYGGIHLLKTGPFCELLPNESLLWEDHGVAAEEILHFYVDFVFYVRVKSYLPVISEKMLELPVIQYFRGKCTLNDFKQVLHKETGLDPLFMHLIYDGRELVPVVGVRLENTLSREKIPHEGTLQLFMHDWTINITTLYANHPSVSFQVEVNSNENENNAKERVAMDKNWSGSDDPVLLLPDGTVLSGDKNLRDHGMTNHCTLIGIPNCYYTKDPTSFCTNSEGCTIPQAELRGISLHQLREVSTAVLTHCKQKEWWRLEEGNKRRLLRPSEVTLYDLMKHFIIPETRERQCSYVELVADPCDARAQRPKYFCSHWWGETVLDFVACIERHAFDRDLPATASYWVCAYALNQHNILNELKSGTTDHKETPFYKAIQLTEGAVAVLDSGAELYDRLWCVFELAVVFTDRKELGAYSYDIYTLPYRESNWQIGDIPVGLSEGPVTSDYHPKFSNGNLNKTVSHATKQIERHSSFPLHLCERSFSLQLERASVSHDEDRSFILNAIIGKSSEASAKPPSSHDAYNTLNRLLRGRFAESLYRTALENGQSMKAYRKALLGAPLKHMTMDFRKCEAFGLESEVFFDSLPTSLESLLLDMSFTKLETIDGLSCGLDRLSNISFLKVDLSDCVHIQGKCQNLWSTIRGLPKLKELRLQMKALRWDCFATPRPCFSEYPLASGISPEPQAHKQIAPPESKFSFDIGHLHPKNLMTLSLDLSFNDELLCLDAVGDSLARMRRLRELHVSAHVCTQITSLEKLSRGLVLLMELEILEVGLGCTAVRSVGPIGRAITKVHCLKEIKLDFAFCENLYSIKEVFHAISTPPLLHNLKRLELDFSQTKNWMRRWQFKQRCTEESSTALAMKTTSIAPDIDFLRTELLQRLKTLRLRLNGRPIRSSDGLAEAIKKLPRGYEFDVLHLVLAGGGRALCQALCQQEILASSFMLKFPGMYPFYSQGHLYSDWRRSWSEIGVR